MSQPADAPHLPPDWRGPTEREMWAAQDDSVSAQRKERTVLKDLSCPHCRKRTLGWVTLLGDERDLDAIRFELAAPVLPEPVDDGDEPGTWVAYRLIGRPRAAAPSIYLGGLEANATFRVTCRCGQRNFIHSRSLLEFGRMA